MLKIEVIKFEAQDIITTSNPATSEEVKCICDELGNNNAHGRTGEHDGCPAEVHDNCHPVM